MKKIAKYIFLPIVGLILILCGTLLAIFFVLTIVGLFFIEIPALIIVLGWSLIFLPFLEDEESPTT